MPADAVAVVGDVEIPKERFARWFGATAMSAPGLSTQILSTPAQFRALAVEYPRFSSCVGVREKLGAPTAPARTDCRTVFKSNVPQVMSPLIQYEWVRAEARSRGIEAVARKVRRAIEKIERDERKAAAQNQLAPRKRTPKDMRLRAAEMVVLQDELKAKKVNLARVGQRMRKKTVCRVGYVVPLCGDTDKD